MRGEMSKSERVINVQGVVKIALGFWRLVINYVVDSGEKWSRTGIGKTW